MVVHFALDVASSADECHPVKKKYLISRTREHKNSIFDYVHLSSSLLRKVRYGQSLDAALQTRSPWNGEASVSPATVSHPSRAPCPLSIWRNLDDAQHNAQSPSRRGEGTFNPRSDKTHAHDGAIRYGRPIQLQATDGGFLAVDADGCLVKLPSSHREDPSTLLTLFPQNPLLAPRSKSHVLSGELCFLVVGSATIHTDHDVQYADSKRTYGPPAALCNAVVRHQLQHGNLARPRVKIRDDQSSTVWCFRRTTTTTPTGTRPEVLETGMLVQIRQRDWTMHYETERIAKKKYTPMATTPMELSSPEAEDSPPAESSRSAPFTHVWLQQNDLSSQHQGPQLKSAKTVHHWDNLWFLIDVTSDRESERRRKQQDAEREAERDAALRITDDPEDRDDNRDHTKCQDRVDLLANGMAGNNHEDDRSQPVAKRVSVLHARIFVSHKAEQAQRHAAAIVVRFLRRVFRREAERRAKELIDRRIIRCTNKHLPQQVDGCELLTTHQQLRILQCFKPNIYGSQHAMMMESASDRIPGISLQGSKHPQQEAQRLVSMARDLKYLGSPEFKQVAVPRASSSSSPSSSHQLSLPPPRRQLRTPHQQLSKEKRDRDHRIHVQLAMVHREKPSFRFGKPTSLQGRHQQLQHGHQYQLRPQTAPASPVPNKLTGWKA